VRGAIVQGIGQDAVVAALIDVVTSPDCDTAALLNLQTIHDLKRATAEMPADAASIIPLVAA
jgi:hypothetical protein